MRAVVQRVSQARVEVSGDVVGEIGRGLLVLVGAARGDEIEAATNLARKVAGLRIFPDEEDKMNLDVRDIGGSVLAVSQFTLLGDCRKGRRPSFVDAEQPESAVRLFDAFVGAVRNQGLRCDTGIFGANMRVELVNDGPVTLLIDTTKVF